MISFLVRLLAPHIRIWINYIIWGSRYINNEILKITKANPADESCESEELPIKLKLYPELKKGYTLNRKIFLVTTSHRRDAGPDTLPEHGSVFFMFITLLSCRAEPLLFFKAQRRLSTPQLKRGKRQSAV